MIVVGSIASLNVAVTVFVRQLAMLASGGLMAATVGAVASVVAAVVKVQT